MAQRRKVRPGLPIDLRDLHAALATINRRIDDLDPASPPEAFDNLADELFRALTLARNLGRRSSLTGCDLHPHGAVDPCAPDGSSQCLICNTHRRRGRSAASMPASDLRDAEPIKRYNVPDSTTGLAELRSRMRTLNDLEYTLDLESPPELTDAIADALFDAFCLARELARPLPHTGCRLHPHGPVDTDPPSGGSDCLICNMRLRRGTAQIPERRRLRQPQIRQPIIPLQPPSLAEELRTDRPAERPRTKAPPTPLITSWAVEPAAQTDTGETESSETDEQRQRRARALIRARREREQGKHQPPTNGG